MKIGNLPKMKVEGRRPEIYFRRVNRTYYSCKEMNSLIDGLKGVSPSVTFGEGSEGASPERRVEDPSPYILIK